MEVKEIYKDHMRYQKVVCIAVPIDTDESILRQMLSGVSPNDVKCDLYKLSTIELLDHLIKTTGE